MVLLLLSALLVAEVVLAVRTVRSGSEQRTPRLGVRVASLTVVVLLVAAGAIDWGPRYYALAVWLLVLTTVAVVGRLVDRRAGRGARTGRVVREVRTRRVVLRSAGVIIGTFLATVPALVFPEYSPIEPTGAFGVRTSTSTVTDPTRVETYSGSGTSRSVTVGFWYPDVSAGPEQDQAFPLVVFSHGGTGIRSGNESLFGELASHGYVVASIDHPYHALVTTDETGQRVWIDRGYLSGLRAEDARADPSRSHAYYEEWMTIRMADIDLVIDHVLTEAGRGGADGVYRLVDPQRIGVAGHSLGGSAALGIGRSRDDVGAVLALESPFMADIRGVRDGQFVWEEAAYPTPVLSVYSDSAWSHLSEWPQYARNHELLTAESADVVHLHIAGAGHLGLTDLALTSPFLTRLLDGRPTHDARDALETLNRAGLEFFDAHLKGAAASASSP